MKNMKRLIILVFILFRLTYLSDGQDVKVTSSFDSTRIFIGDQIKYIVTVDKPSDLNLSLPVFKDTICKNIEILSGPVVDSSFLNGRTKIIEKYLITSFDSGSYQISPVFAEVKNKGGLKRFYSDYSQLKVMRVKLAPADTTAKIFDIIEPYKAPVTAGDILPWFLLLVVIGALTWFIIRFIRKFRESKTGIEAPVNTDPAHVIAFRELEKLKEERLWQKGEVKSYYTKLTGILRQYLEDRYHVFSLELTTGETLDALVKRGFKKNGLYKQLKIILTGADLVKFAKYNPEPSENDEHFQNSWEFVLATREEEIVNATVDEKDDEREEGL
jgi:hypothetical protein